jgi:hypothetical protein
LLIKKQFTTKIPLNGGEGTLFSPSSSIPGQKRKNEEVIELAHA